MENKNKLKTNLKKATLITALLVFVISVFSVFFETKKESPIQLKINDVLQANESIQYESCVNKANLINFEETNNANYIVEMYFWDCDQFTSKENKISTIEKTVERYFRSIERIANKNKFDSKKIGEVFDSNSIKINIIYNDKEINSAFLEKTLQKVSWENEWQNIN